MATRKPRGARSRSFGLTLVTLLLVAAVLVITILLVKDGRVPVPFTDSALTLAGVRPNETKAPAVDMVTIPVSARAIPAYTKVMRDDLVNPRTKRLAVVQFPKAHVSPRAIRDLAKIQNRVLKRDKAAGYAFTEADFMPAGTRPGLAAGIPAGKRAMVVTPTEVSGLHALNPGDRFDIIATIPLDDAAADRSKLLNGLKGVYASHAGMLSQMGRYDKQASVRVIVHNGVAVTAVRERRPATAPHAASTANAATRGLRPGSKTPAEEFVMAIAPGEVAPLAQAIHVGAKLACVPRSGRPEESHESTTPELVPKLPAFGLGGASERTADGTDGIHLVERISGQERSVFPVPTSAPTEPTRRTRPPRQ